MGLPVFVDSPERSAHHQRLSEALCARADAREGREALATLARNNQPEKSGPAATRHFLTNVIITPTSEGAVGRQYNVLIDVGNVDKPSAIDHGGHYEDVYVKTPAGWRFRSRTYVRSKLGPKPNPPPPSQ